MIVVIDDDKDVESLNPDKVCRTSAEGFDVLCQGEAKVVYMDHYLDSPFVGINTILDALEVVEEDKHPEVIYFISSDKFQNIKNANLVREIFPHYKRGKAKLLELGKLTVTGIPVTTLEERSGG